MCGIRKKQTYKRLEIILVNDGSTDGSDRLCDELALTDTRIKVIHKVNGGLSSARNAGIDSAKGDYLMFVDSDDFIAPYMVQGLLYLIITKNADVSCFAIIKYWDSQKQKLCHQPSSTMNGIEALMAMLRREIDMASWNKLYKSEIIGNTRFPLGRFNEDVMFLTDIFLKPITIVSSDHPYYFYRERKAALPTHSL